IRLLEPQMEGGAGVDAGFDGDGCSVVFGEEARVVKAETRAFPQRFGRKERVENGTQEPGGNAFAGVLDGKADHRRARRNTLEIWRRRELFVTSRAESQVAPFGHGIGGIERKINDDLLELNGIDIEGQLSGLK